MTFDRLMSLDTTTIIRLFLVANRITSQIIFLLYQHINKQSITSDNSNFDINMQDLSIF